MSYIYLEENKSKFSIEENLREKKEKKQKKKKKKTFCLLNKFAKEIASMRNSVRFDADQRQITNDGILKIYIWAMFLDINRDGLTSNSAFSANMNKWRRKKPLFH